MKLFENQVAVVTGAREGVGRTIAESIAAGGGKVILVSRGEPKETIRAVEENGGICLGYIQCDISKEDQVTAMAEKVRELSGGKVDVLVNNAGFNGKAHLVKDMPLEDWNYTVSVNLTGTMMVCREMIPLMNPEKAAIVNVSSNVARRGIPYRSDYCCTKWALLGLTQTLALELADRNIRVNAVCPGPINGDRIEQLLHMHAEAEHRDYDEMYQDWLNVPMKRFVEPEEVAEVVMFLASGKSSSMTGQALNVTGGMIMT